PCPMARPKLSWQRAEMRAAAVLCLLFAACGPGAAELPLPPDGGAPDASVVVQPPDAGPGAPDAGPALHEGVLFGVRGVRYVSGATSGLTDAGGAFQWEDGARIVFYSGGLELADVEAAPLLTP